MAEPEDLLSDAARHATVFARRLWRRYHPLPEGPPTATLAHNAPRLDLLVTAVTGATHSIRIAQAPARPTFFSRVLKHSQPPWQPLPLPATNDQHLWLPPDLGITDLAQGDEFYRVMALQQALRAQRGSATALTPSLSPLLADMYLLLEACAADILLTQVLPGMSGALDRLRRYALAQRPPLEAFSRARQPLELWVRQLLQSPHDRLPDGLLASASPQDSLCQAEAILDRLGLNPNDSSMGTTPLFKDWWTGELRPSSAPAPTLHPAGEPQSTEPPGPTPPPRGSKLPRRPEVREAQEDEDDDQEPGAWMVQPDEPHQQAEDPLGMNRPLDRDEDISADEYSDMLSDLPEARLISTPGRPKEVLMSDDPPDTNTAQQLKRAIQDGRGIHYPEWNYRAQCYREPGATVRLLPCLPGSQPWVDATLEKHQALLNQIRRRFEMLSAHRVTRRKLLDGDDIDLNAYVDSYANFRGGGSLSEELYQTRRTAERDLAITLLIDISGSTDGWVSANRRIIDVEREALLLVCAALEGMGEPYAVEAFSGEGPDAVIVRQIKAFDERFDNDIALRISSLEPEHYTRVGAAIRHATTGLMQQAASHRLLLVLSDGKPNDKDEYEGRFGVEDTRQAVIEATLQGISAFCLTIDRQAPSYLPRIFGAHQYALLQQPERLPTVLLDWMKRLVAH